eukprot:TRINITY_DN1528_c0_g1_i1.p1 TRINITY_DN1528_c0_g1~~TRINITY_DN1528_c0_g1_i1.p1  ORF type:complete len:482 (+),score=36.19 TRINITY_DN1528_c0_g1_i1:226-1671(+)
MCVLVVLAIVIVAAFPPRCCLRPLPPLAARHRTAGGAFPDDRRLLLFFPIGSLPSTVPRARRFPWRAPSPFVAASVPCLVTPPVIARRTLPSSTAAVFSRCCLSAACRLPRRRGRAASLGGRRLPSLLPPGYVPSTTAPWARRSFRRLPSAIVAASYLPDFAAATRALLGTQATAVPPSLPPPTHRPSAAASRACPGPRRAPCLHSLLPSAGLPPAAVPWSWRWPPWTVDLFPVGALHRSGVRPGAAGVVGHVIPIDKCVRLFATVELGQLSLACHAVLFMFSEDTRQHVFGLLEEGYHASDVAEIIGCSMRSMRRWLRYEEENGSTWRDPRLLNLNEDAAVRNSHLTRAVLTLVESEPSAFLRDHVDLLVALSLDFTESDHRYVNAATVYRVLRHHPQEDRAAVRGELLRRPAFFCPFCSTRFPLRCVVSVDETHTGGRDMYLRYGRSLRNVACALRDRDTRPIARTSTMMAVTLSHGVL